MYEAAVSMCGWSWGSEKPDSSLYVENGPGRPSPGLKVRAARSGDTAQVFDSQAEVPRTAPGSL